MSTTVVCPPNSDVQNAGALVGAATYFEALAVNDGDAKRIKNAQGNVNVCGVDWSAVPIDATVLSVAVRWTEAGTSTDTTFSRAGLQHLPTTHVYDAGARAEPPHTYGTFTEAAFTSNPETGLPWRRSDLDSFALHHRVDSAPSELQYPRFTELVAVVVYDPRPPIGEADASSGAPVSDGSASAPSASGSASAPTASAGPGSASASAIAAQAAVSASSSAPSASGASGGAASSSGSSPSCSVSASGPTATVVSSAPTATVSGSPPSAGGS